jgi:hypothetical protein
MEQTDPTLTPVGPPEEYDPDAERWVAETHNPHANAAELYEQAQADPGYLINEFDPYQPELIDWTPAELIASTPQPREHATGFPGIEHLDTAYTNYTPAQQTVGQVTVNLTAAAVAAALGDAADLPLTRQALRSGPGILLGYIATMNGAQVTKFMALVDAVNDDGPVLALINTAVPANGMATLGHDGIQFERGLTLINLGANPAVVIPVIRRDVPRKLGAR